MLGSPILYLKGMRIVMFQLSGFYYRKPEPTCSATQMPTVNMSTEKVVKKPGVASGELHQAQSQLQFLRGILRLSKRKEEDAPDHEKATS